MSTCSAQLMSLVVPAGGACRQGEASQMPHDNRDLCLGSNLVF